MRSIAVIATYDDAMNYNFVGLTVFSNTNGRIAVPDWQLGSVFEQRVAEKLGGRIQVKPIEGDGVAAPFRALRASDSPTLDRYAALIKSLPSQGVDAYLLVDLGSPTDNGPEPGGYGIYRRGSFGFYNSYEYQTVRVYLFDAKTGADLAYVLPCVPDGEDCKRPFILLPDRPDWPEEASAVTEAQKSRMKTDFIAMTRGLADSTVDLMGLNQ